MRTSRRLRRTVAGLALACAGALAVPAVATAEPATPTTPTTPVSYTHLRAHQTRMFISFAVFCF